MSHLTHKRYTLSYENKFYSKSDDTDGVCLIKKIMELSRIVLIAITMIDFAA